MIIKNRKTCRISKQLLADKVKVSDKELKENTKKLHILIKVKSSSSDKEGLSDKKLKRKLKKFKRS